MDIRYRTIIGAANKSMFAMSPVGDKRAAAIKIAISAVFQIRTRSPAVTKPILART
jgi:hypothetical protein